MKKVLVGVLALGTVSAFAGIDKVPSLKEILSKQTCTVSVVNRPIDFDKGTTVTRTGRIYLMTKNDKDLNKVRRLAVGRSLLVSGLERGMDRILVSDKSIYGFCVDYIDGNDDCDAPGELTLAEIEEYSDFNLKVNCSKDDVVLL